MLNEESTLGLSIKARIEPVIEGANQFEQNLQQLPQQITSRVQQVVGSPGFQADLSPQQIKDVQDWVKYSQGLYEPIQQEISGMMEDLSVDLSTGKLTKGQIDKYTRKIARLRQGFGALGGELGEDAGDFLKNIDPERIEIIKSTVKTAVGEIGDDIGTLQDKFKNLTQSINQSTDAGGNFFQELKRMGLWALGGAIVKEGMDWIGTGYQIEARQRTAFDLTSPMGMYGEQRMADVFTSNKERERLYGVMGTGIGGIVGFGLGGPIGAGVGAMFGGMAGSTVANWFGMEATSEAEQELKFANQVYGTLSQYVGGAQQYDVSRTLLRAGLGRGAVGSLNMGYTPEQEMQMRMTYGSMRGVWDGGQYEEQTMFGRAYGIDPQQLYALDLSGRVTGMDYGLSGLYTQREFAQGIFGENISPARVLEVLNEIKTIAEQQLKLNVNADAKDSLRFAQLPEAIFGTGSPYGRLGDLGGTTMELLERLMMPTGPAHEAFLFQAMGTDNVMDFTEMMKGGIYSGDNLMKIMQMVKRYTGGDKSLNYFTLNEMIPSAPQGFIPQLSDFMNNPDTWAQMQTPEGKGDVRKKIEELIQNNISATEKMNENVREVQIATAESWRDTIYKVSVDMAKFWQDLGGREEIHRNIAEKLDMGFDAMIRKLVEFNFIDIRTLNKRMIEDVMDWGSYFEMMGDKGYSIPKEYRDQKASYDYGKKQWNQSFEESHKIESSKLNLHFWNVTSEIKDSLQNAHITGDWE